jgi:N-methylhydantoinase B
MPAKLIETNQQEFAKTQVDPVTLDIIENALRNARVEMDATLFRTALSPSIREQGDAFPLIADRSGKMVVGQFGSFIDGFLRAYDGEIEEGDVILLCDPYSCEGAVSHNNDQLIIMPIYRHGRIITWAAMFGHMTDIGGKVPGSLPTDAASVFEEGLRLPPVKLYRKGVFQEDILKIAMFQSRMPEWYKADLHAIVASHLISQAIGEEPVSFEDYVCDDGLGNGPFKIKCAMWREGDKVILDFDGTDPQSESSINFYLNENMFKMFFGIYMIMVFDPQILFNDGFYDLVDVRIPKRSLLKPEFPAALSCRTHALGRIFDILGGLLGQKTPEFLNAAGFSSSPHLMYSGFDDNGEWYQLFQIGFGGIPGRPLGDGMDGHSLWPGFTNVPNEFLENYFPLIIEKYESAIDSGGPGLHRGGNGIHMTYRFLQRGKVSIHDDRWFVPPWGVNGGLPARRSWKVLEKTDGTKVPLGSKMDHVEVDKDDLLHYVTWGGGGWGDPLERDAEIVAAEVRRGLVSVEGAKDYGVVLKKDNTVDSSATEKLRKKMAADRGEPSLFDFGPDIESLRKTCLKDTGLPAPKQPIWKQSWASEKITQQSVAAL